MSERILNKSKTYISGTGWVQKNTQGTLNGERSKYSLSREMRPVDPTVSKIQELPSVQTLFTYIKELKNDLNCFQWIAVLNKIEHFNNNQITSFTQLHELEEWLNQKKINTFSMNQLQRITDFFLNQSFFCPTYQKSLESLIIQMPCEAEVKRVILQHGVNFSALTWINTITHLLQLGVSKERIGHAIEFYLKGGVHGSENEISELYQYLETLGILLPFLQMKKSQPLIPYDKQALTNKLSSFRHSDLQNNNISELLTFVTKHLPLFNNYHWAVFASQLYRMDVRSNFRINQEIKGILDKLPHSLQDQETSPGQIAQIIGGFIPFLRNSPGSAKFLLHAFVDQLPKMTKQEKLMIIHAMRKNPTITEFLSPILDFYLEQTIEPDLFASLFHCCVKLGHTSDFSFFENRMISYIENDFFSLQSLGEILNALAFVKTNNKQRISKQFCAYILNAIITKLHSATKEEKSKTLGITVIAMLTLDYRDEKLMIRLIQEARSPDIHLKEKISLATTLAKFQLSNDEIKAFIEEVSYEFIRECDLGFSIDYPIETVWIAYAAAFHFRKDAPELTEKLLELAIPCAGNELDDKMLLKISHWTGHSL